MAAEPTKQNEAIKHGLAVVADSPMRIFWRRFKKRKPALIAAWVLLVVFILAIFAPVLAPFDPEETVLSLRFARPLTEFEGRTLWFGADALGRDILSRALFGARVSLQVGFLATGLSLTLGVIIGAISGFYGGWIDNFLMRIVDVFLSIPSLLLLITVVAVFSPSVPKGKEVYLLMGVLGFLGWPGSARLVRGEFLSVKERDFVEAARALGAKDMKIIFRHILPNVMGPIIVSATLGVAGAILAEASLSYLGLGIQPPVPSWGKMIFDGQAYLRRAWWLATFPGLMTMCTTLSLYMVGDGLREALDPRLKR